MKMALRPKVTRRATSLSTRWFSGFRGLTWRSFRTMLTSGVVTKVASGRMAVNGLPELSLSPLTGEGPGGGVPPCKLGDAASPEPAEGAAADADEQDAPPLPQRARLCRGAAAACVSAHPGTAVPHDPRRVYNRGSEAQLTWGGRAASDR